MGSERTESDFKEESLRSSCWSLAGSAHCPTGEMVRTQAKFPSLAKMWRKLTCSECHSTVQVYRPAFPNNNNPSTPWVAGVKPWCGCWTAKYKNFSNVGTGLSQEDPFPGIPQW